MQGCHNLDNGPTGHQKNVGKATAFQVVKDDTVLITEALKPGETVANSMKGTKLRLLYPEGKCPECDRLRGLIADAAEQLENASRNLFGLEAYKVAALLPHLKEVIEQGERE